MKLIHSEYSKLDKSSFTGCCHSSQNPKAATYKVKDSFTKTWRAFTLYWEAMLHSAWKEMATEHADIIKSIEEVLRDSGPAAAVAKFQ